MPKVRLRCHPSCLGVWVASRLSSVAGGVQYSLAELKRETAGREPGLGAECKQCEKACENNHVYVLELPDTQALPLCCIKERVPKRTRNMVGAQTSDSDIEDSYVTSQCNPQG